MKTQHMISVMLTPSQGEVLFLLAGKCELVGRMFIGNSPLLLTVGLGLSKVEQFQRSVSTEVKKSIDIPCKIRSTNFANDVIHWYWQKPNQALEHLIYISSTKSAVQGSMGQDNVFTLIIPGRPLKEIKGVPGKADLGLESDNRATSFNLQKGGYEKHSPRTLVVASYDWECATSGIGAAMVAKNTPYSATSLDKSLQNAAPATRYPGGLPVDVWRHQNENISGSTLLHTQTRQNSAHKVQAVWGSSREDHCALTNTKGNSCKGFSGGGQQFGKKIKLFGPGTKLIITDKHLDADVSPKPTIFLPSIAETNLHKAGTYLCLLEKFFPDVIKIHWQEKKSNTILGSQEGNTVKTNDTYMKFSWLTVPEKSLDKEYRCIVRHENNKNGVDQEIIFPPIKADVITMDPKDNCSKDANVPRGSDLSCHTSQGGAVTPHLTKGGSYEHITFPHRVLMFLEF
ncbi:hypothetical protein H8959_007614 [Pygathrix nigripes]